MTEVVTFQEPQELANVRRAGARIAFHFTVVDKALIGAPEERSRTRDHSITVEVLALVQIAWGREGEDLLKIMFEYGKRHVIQKLRDRTLTQDEELLLTQENTECPCPFDPNRIELRTGQRIEVDVPDRKGTGDPQILELAGSIIDTRDNINAIFKQRHGENLFLLQQERDLLQLTRECENSEEFSYRLCAMANTVGNMNVPKLRELTGLTDTKLGSVGLLEIYITSRGSKCPDVIPTLRSIVHLRKGYPVHSDTLPGVVEAHAFFRLPYPVLDFTGAWRCLLARYLQALKKLLDCLRQ